LSNHTALYVDLGRRRFTSDDRTSTDVGIAHRF
jgi:hypothetical protein